MKQMHTHHGSEKKVVKVFGLMALGLILSFGFAFCLAQQVIRSSANDPQVEISEGVTDGLNQGQDPAAFSQVAPTNISKSLSPFVLVYDQDRKAVSGTGKLDENIPVPPDGVFAKAKEKGENRVTWQPKEGVRIAAVVKPYVSKDKSGFVLVGKSLKEAESRIKNLMQLSVISLAGSLVVSLVAVNLVLKKKEETPAAERVA